MGSVFRRQSTPTGTGWERQPSSPQGDEKRKHMGINFLDLLGIHQYDIETSESIINDELEYLGIEGNELALRTIQYLCEETITEDLGNTIISCMLEAAAGMVTDKLGGERPEMELYCNGACSCFSVLDHDVRESLHYANKCGLDYAFVRWIREKIPDTTDFEDFVERSDDVHMQVLQNLYEADGNLCWSYKSEMSEQEIEAREKECLENPDDIEKAFLVGASGKIWESC